MSSQSQGATQKPADPVVAFRLEVIDSKVDGLIDTVADIDRALRGDGKHPGMRAELDRIASRVDVLEKRDQSRDHHALLSRGQWLALAAVCITSLASLASALINTFGK